MNDCNLCFVANVLFVFDKIENVFNVKLSFQEWTQQVQDMLNTKKFGDIAFRDKDFKNAIEYYSKVLLKFSQFWCGYCFHLQA